MGGTVRMKLFAKQQTDEEFLQSVRRQLAAAPRRRALELAGGFALVLVGLLWMVLLSNLLLTRLLAQTAGGIVALEGGAGGTMARLPGPVSPKQYDDAMHTATVAGLGVGACGAVLVLLGVRLLSDAAAGRRQERLARLLLDCRDAAAKAGRPQDGETGGPGNREEGTGNRELGPGR